MNDNLLIKKGDNIFNRITQISGNVDNDKITPSIWMAQVNHIKRILGQSLYAKILNDFTANALTGPYLEIFDDHVSAMLVMFTTADFVMKNSIIIGNGGVFSHTAANSQVVDFKAIERLSKYYLDMGANFELQFYDYMRGVNIPEYKNCDGGAPDNNFQLSWCL